MITSKSSRNSVLEFLRAHIYCLEVIYVIIYLFHIYLGSFFYISVSFGYHCVCECLLNIDVYVRAKTSIRILWTSVHAMLAIKYYIIPRMRSRLLPLLQSIAAAAPLRPSEKVDNIQEKVDSAPPLMLLWIYTSYIQNMVLWISTG